jgi:hypothetical protein
MPRPRGGVSAVEGPSGFPQVEGHAQTDTERGGDLTGLDESNGKVEGQRMRVAGDPQTPMTGFAGNIDDVSAR